MGYPSITPAAFTITLASLGGSGSGRSVAEVNNTSTKYLAATVSVELTSGGSAPTVGKTYDVYLLRNDNDGTDPIRDDNWAGTNASFTRENAPLLGTIVVTATADKEFRGIFDTWPLGPIGPKWGIAIVNNSGQSLSSTEADSFCRYAYYIPDAVA